MGITVFAAVATPSTDPLTMWPSPAPSWCCTSARWASPCSTTSAAPPERGRADPDDDEASDLDLTPEDVGEVETVSASRALPEQDGVRTAVNGYDDVT